MSERGRLPSKSPVHEEMFGGGDQPLWTPQDMADLHVMIIYNVGEVIGGETVCFYHHGIPLHLKVTEDVFKNERSQKKSGR